MSDFVFYNRATPRDIRNTLRGGCSNSFTRGLHLETPFQLFILTQPRNINLFCTLVYRKLQRGKLCSRTLFWQGREEAALFFHWTSSRSGTLDPVKPSFVNHWTIHEHVWKWDSISFPVRRVTGYTNLFESSKFISYHYLFKCLHSGSQILTTL